MMVVAGAVHWQVTGVGGDRRDEDGERNTGPALARRERELKVGMFRDKRELKRDEAKQEGSNDRGWANGFVVGDNVEMK